MLDDVRQHAIPFGLYMREEHSITHLTVSRLRVDFVVANSQFLATQARSAGYICSFVPSIVDLGASQVQSRRRTVVLVNPIQENRPEILRELARLRSDIPCVLQESWALSDSWRAELRTWADNLPNLTLQRPVPRPAEVYRNARLIVAPYPSGRPRVVLESQFNGIPVIGADQYALREALGAGGILVGPDSPLDEWIRTIIGVWDDARYYGELSESAYRHARRSEVDPETIVTHFEQVVAGVTQ
ncbi:MAG: glycosyltransferase [Actinobacteria bacterium]|nr:glycosyltransferase [Actinomycetota bacterium]